MSAGANQLIALLAPNTAAADEHPGGTGGLVVAWSADNSGVAVTGQRHRGALGPQPPSRRVGRADQLTAMLGPRTAAADEDTCRSGRANRRRAIAIGIVGARPANDSDIAVCG